MTDMGALDRADVAAKPAVIVDGRVTTYGALEDRTNRLAHVLLAHGVEPLDRVAVMLPNGAELLEVGLATAKIGAVLVPVNWHLKRDEVTWILADSGARVVVARPDFVDDLPADTARLFVGDHYEGALAGASATRPDRPGFGSPEYLFYTSGTTGRPRGVERDRPEPGRPPMVGAIAAMWGLTADDVYLAASPLHHAACGYAFAHLYLGATVVVLPRWDAREWLRLVQEHRVTVTFAVPAHFIRLLEVPDEERAGYDTSSLRLILHAAAPCPVPVKRRAIEAFPSAEIWEFYGASEGGATRISPGDWLAHPGSVGTPWPGTEIVVLDDDGNELPPGGTGVIYVRPPPQTSRFRYHGDADKTAGAWAGDAFTVGDVGFLDDDGYLYITDRASDMILRGGVNVYPAEIERCLHTHPAVVDCAVFGVPDERLGEAIMALVETRHPVDVDDLRAHCRAHLADFKCPQHFELVDRLPRDALGKVRKRQLRDEHWQGRANAVRAD